MTILSDLSPYPILELALDGVLLPGRDLAGLTGLRLQQRLSQPSLCELYFRDPPGPLDFLSAITPGQTIQVGVQGMAQDLFHGDVTALEYHYLPNNQREVYLRAYDPLHRLRRRQSVRTFEGKSLADLAAGLCRDLGFQQLIYPRDTLTWPMFVQHSQSDLDLLAEMAAREGLYLTIQGDDLHLVSLEGLRDEPIPLQLDGNLFEAHLEVNTDSSSKRVVAWAWDASDAQPIMGEAVVPRSARQSPAQAENGSTQRSLLDVDAPTRQHAAALAQAELDLRAASEVIFQGVASGNADLRPGRRVDICGVAETVSGCYVLTSVTHLIDSSGYRTELDSTPPEPRRRPRADLATLGEVIDACDPDHHARVRVRLPAFNNIASGWLPVALPGAGENKGMISLPEVGDTVVVLVLRDIPSMVLGGLYGYRKAPETDVELGHIRSYSWISPGKQKIQLYDGLLGGKIRLESGSGSYIELDGGHITIAGREIDFIQT